MWLVVGLGNPGDEYAATRHNAGFMLVERLAEAWGVELRGRLFKARTALARRGGEEAFLVAPKTFMNRSGVAVREAMAGKDVPAERLIVVYDDLDIALGEIRTDEFPRIRIGIGPCPAGRDAAEYVLEPFRRDERPLVDRSLEEAVEALEMILDGRIDRAMTRYNRRIAADPGT